MPRFRSRPIEIDAVQLRTPIEIPGGRGRRTQTGKAGDWLVTYPDNRQGLLTGAELDRIYAPVEELVVIGSPAKSRRTIGRRKMKPRQAKKTAAVVAGRIGADDPKLLTMRQQYESGVPVPRIAHRLKVTPAAVYYHAATKKWKRGDVKNLGRRRCPHCEQLTTDDPCQHCGKAVAA